MNQKRVKVRNVVIGAGIPVICIPVVGVNDTEILDGMQRAVESRAQMIEWRTDFYEDLRKPYALERLLKKIREIIGDTVLLFTFRTLQEGGNASLSIADYMDVNQLAVQSGEVDGIDVEYNRAQQGCAIEEMIAQAHAHNVFVILSKHDFDKTPQTNEMEQYFEESGQTQADLVKLAVMPHNAEDVLRLLDVTQRWAAKISRPLITMAMGAMGSITRACGEYFGSAVTFATAGKSSAPGQFEAEKLRVVLETFHEGIQKEKD